MKPETTITLAITLALAIALVGGLIIVPAIEQADAANAISDARNKGKQGESASAGHSRGGHHTDEI